MSDNSKIEWTQATWNCVTGCTKVSAGCDHCYAETFAERWRGIPGHHFEQGFDVRLWPERLTIPLRWKRPRRIFVNSMSDMFHEAVPDEFIARMFVVMALAPQHTYQLLTKRHGRMHSLLSSGNEWRELLYEAADWAVGIDLPIPAERFAEVRRWIYGTGCWPEAVASLPSLWLGVSAEDQHWADIRIPALLKTPAAVRWVSAEPLLGPLSLKRWLPVAQGAFCEPHWSWLCGNDINGGECRQTRLSWAVVGGESGPGAREMDLAWARAILRDCRNARVPAFMKQVGSVSARQMPFSGTKGGTWDAWPDDLQVRQFPAAADLAGVA